MKSVLDRTGNVGQLLIGWGPELESNPNTLVWFSTESALCVCVSPWVARAVTVSIFQGKLRHLARSSGFPEALWVGFALPHQPGGGS